MATKQAKAAHRAATKKQGGFERMGDGARFIVLNRGQHCYVLTTIGKTVHTKVGSEVFITEATLLYATAPDKIAAELSAGEDKYPGLGWGATLATITAPADEPVAA